MNLPRASNVIVTPLYLSELCMKHVRTRYIQNLGNLEQCSDKTLILEILKDIIKKNYWRKKKEHIVK